MALPDDQEIVFCRNNVCGQNTDN